MMIADICSCGKDPKRQAGRGRDTHMQLLLKRHQRTALMGGITFILDVRAELTAEEHRNIRRYKLGNTLLYQRYQMTDPGSGWLGVISRLIFKMRNIEVTVWRLVNGVHLEFNDIHEMLAVEEHFKEASRNFKNFLDATSGFGGEDLIELS
jgi:hypothetical protein